MKEFFIAVLLVGLIAAPALARGSRDVCDGYLASIMNECHEVSHPANPSEDEQAAEIGVGLDLILLEGAADEVSYKVTGEYRYDINNSTHAAYGVVTLKLAELGKQVKGLFK